jgi:ribosomal protein L37E
MNTKEQVICERCWKVSKGSRGNRFRTYESLVQNHTCTPEEQAGDNAEICKHCGRKTYHVSTERCMNCEEG